MKSITKDHLFRLLRGKEDPEHLPGLTAHQKGPDGQSTIVFEDPTIGSFFALDYTAVKDAEGAFQVQAPSYEEEGVERLPVREVRQQMVTRWVDVVEDAPAATPSN